MTVSDEDVRRYYKTRTLVSLNYFCWRLHLSLTHAFKNALRSKYNDKLYISNQAAVMRKKRCEIMDVK